MATQKDALHFEAGYLSLDLDATGSIVSLADSRSGRNYIPLGKSAPFVSLVINGQQVMPTVAHAISSDLYAFINEDKKLGFQINVHVIIKNGYTTFEVTQIDGPAKKGDGLGDEFDIQALLWGPLPTVVTVGDSSNGISGVIGEAAGVVHDQAFAIGLKPLNDRTEASWPRDYPQYGWQDDVDPNPYGQNVDPALEQWSVAAKTSWGSVLRAFTFDYTRRRRRLNASGYPVPVGPLSSGGEIIGSKIALFGCSPELVTTLLSFIASGEGLPYPTQGGQWQKAAQASSQSFIVSTYLGSNSVDATAQAAKSAGLNYIYALNGYRGPWQSTGHYEFNSDFGGGDNQAKALVVDKAGAVGIHVGVHTMSDFIADNDPYLSEQASLAMGGESPLSRPLGASDTELYLSDAWPVLKGLPLIDGGDQSGYDSVLLIGHEFIGYFEQNVQQVNASEWKVTGVARAIWDTSGTTAPVGTLVKRVIVNQYRGPVGGLSIIDEIAVRFGVIRNAVGIRANSFDGLESASDSGWGSYGIARLVNGTYKAHAGHDGYITETSRMTSNAWDTLTRASWGSSLDTQGKVQLIRNNAYYQANYLPGMLGWIDFSRLGSMLDMESWLALGAGLNAGMGVWNVDSQNEGVLDRIKQWETARNLGAFTEDQKVALRNPSTYWTLSVIEDEKSWSLQQVTSGGTPIGDPQTVLAPTPQLSSAIQSYAPYGVLYETKIVSNTPATLRFAVTEGTLPPGLQLNQDTGGIVGTPMRGGRYGFTITATNSGGVADASAGYQILVR